MLISVIGAVTGSDEEKRTLCQVQSNCHKNRPIIASQGTVQVCNVCNITL